MYDIRQFRPTLHVLLLIGISGFCLAARAPGLWLLALFAFGMHKVLRTLYGLKAMPGWAAALAAIVFGLVTFQRFVGEPGTSLLTAGQFLVLLQLVKLYQENGGDHRVENRNYAWLLVLSLLLMVAASISTASLLFGLSLFAYLFLGLYVCLLFHLKSEMENVRAAMTIPVDVVNPAVLRQDERFLPASMRRLTALVATAGLVCAVLVFLFFPRGPGAGILGQLNYRPTTAMTGFSENVSFESVARITQSHEKVGTVKITEDGKEVRGARAIYLRGLTLDYYSGDGRDDSSPGFPSFQTAAPWQWTRTRPPESRPMTGASGEVVEFGGPGEHELVQEIKLEPIGTTVLFGLAGPYKVLFPRELHFTFSSFDETLRINDVVAGGVEYTLTSKGVAGFSTKGAGSEDNFPPKAGRGSNVHSNIDPAIAEFARRPEVSGMDARGVSLAKLRGERVRPNKLDATIAANIERYLKTNYRYTLDLTDTVRRPGKDPIVQFLLETKRGHCEYFAGAMVLMCQSLGMDARVVTGYRCDEYNALIGRYVVRQSDAHAWVEVRTGEAELWQPFDPTSSRQADEVARSGMSEKWRRVMDYLEYTWADTVVAYNRDRRDNLIGSMQKSVTNSANSAENAVRNWNDYLPNPASWPIAPWVVGTVIAAISLAGVSAVGYFAWERLKLRRRAERIGLGALRDEDKRRLARQLGFYDDLLRMLSERGYRRPAHLTPLEFSFTLAHLPAETYAAVHRLTRIYYRIRYGRAELAPSYQKRVREALMRLEPGLGPVKGS